MKYNNKFEKAHILVPKWPSALGKKTLKNLLGDASLTRTQPLAGQLKTVF